MLVSFFRCLMVLFVLSDAFICGGGVFCLLLFP